MAIMKRSVIIVNSKKFVYVRRATEREVRVPRFLLETRTFMKDEACPLIARFKSCDYSKPADYDEAKAWEKEWVSTQLAKPPPMEAEDDRAFVGSGAWLGGSGGARGSDWSEFKLAGFGPVDDSSAGIVIPEGLFSDVDIYARMIKKEQEASFYEKNKHLNMSLGHHGFINVETKTKRRRAEPGSEGEVTAEAILHRDMAFSKVWLSEKVAVLSGSLGGGPIVVDDDEPSLESQLADLIEQDAGDAGEYEEENPYLGEWF